MKRKKHRSRTVRSSAEEWIEVRKAHLAKEKEFTRLRDQLSKDQRDLPWVKVDKEYVFDAPEGKKTLADLFDGRSQLIVYHFMFGPEWEEGCPSCSFLSDHVDGARVHLENHDVKYVAISRAPLAKIEPFKKRMGWKFDWVSSNGSDFNYDLKDLNRSIEFFTKLGFTFNPQFTDETATCMVVSEDIFVMLLTHDKFKTFTPKEICDATKSTEVLVCISSESRERVDEMVRKAVAAGGTTHNEPQDHGFMYAHAFQDLDGHIWELIYMEPSALNQD